MGLPSSLGSAPPENRLSLTEPDYFRLGRQTICEYCQDETTLSFFLSDFDLAPQGRTPSETFTDGLQLYNRYVFDGELEEMEAA